MWSETPGRPGHEAARPADDAVDLDAGPRGVVQRLDDLGVDERVDLEHDPAGCAGACQRRLALDELEDPGTERDRRDEQAPERPLAGQAGEHVEQVGDVRAQLLAAGQDPEVHVQPGRLRVVVAGPDVEVASQPGPLAADDERDLRVGLEADEAVHDVRARLLQRPGPDDVVLLVEAGLDLDQDDDLLARSAARMSARTIGESPDVRYSVCLIVRTSGSSAAWEMNRSTEAVNDSYGWCRKMSPARIWANRSTGSSSSVGRRRSGTTGTYERCLEVRAVEVGELPQGGEVHHPGDLERVLVADVDALHQDLAGELGHRALDLEPHGVAEPPAPHLLLDREQEIVRLVLLDRDVGVAGHPEQVRLDDVHAPEQLVEVRLDDLVEEHELVAPDREQPGEQGRDLDPGEPVLAGLRVQQPDGDREAERRDVRERVPGVDGERREDREDLVVEPPPERLVVLRDVVVVEDRDALGPQLLADARPDRGVVRRQLPDADADLRQLLGGGHAVGRLVRRAGLGLPPEPGHADLEELVEVGREDREELHPLEQGIARVTRLVEHARVELDPRQLAVEDRPPLVAREATAWSAGGAWSGCGSNGGHGSSAMPGIRCAARDDATPRSRRAIENTTRPSGPRHPGRVRMPPDQASGTYRRSPDEGSIQTCIATPVVGSMNRSSVGRNRPSGRCVSPPPGPCPSPVCSAWSDR